ncbi:MAG: ABC transporter substrate-binding protein [Actinomycetota bacterium]|nr:ABC transporter substrate-binding protein [Actinomycetota bacterium]
MKRHTLLVVVCSLALVAAACSSGSGNANTTPSATGGGATVNLIMWDGYTPPPPVSEAYEWTSLQSLVDEFNRTHPGIHVTRRYVNSDFALQKLTVALQGNEQPDITYQYGSNMPQLATTPKVVDLTQKVQDPAFNWNDFFPGERTAATVGGRVLGVPALVDNVAVVYNKDLFDAAGLPYPTANWTWDQFRSDAKALTDPAKKQFGWEYWMDGSESTVWEWEAMLWEAGGDILSSDNQHAAFNSAAGVQALTMVKNLVDDGSVYLDQHPDSGKSEELFNSGKVGMFLTGPWDLPSFPDAKYGVQVMPSFGDPTNHQTIAGPDNWVIMDNGPEHVAAAWTFLQWLVDPARLMQDSLATGHLPTRASVEQLPDFAKLDQKFPGVGIFAENLKNVLKARPPIAQYPRISAAIGQAIQQVALNGADPKTALDAAAKAADGILAVPG